MFNQDQEAYFLTTLFYYRYPLITHSWLFTLKLFSPLDLQSECSWLSVDSNTLIPATLSQPARAFTTSTIQWVIDDTIFRLFELMILHLPTFMKRMVLNYFSFCLELTGSVIMISVDGIWLKSFLLEANKRASSFRIFSDKKRVNPVLQKHQ